MLFYAIFNVFKQMNEFQKVTKKSIWLQCDAGQKLQVVPNLVPSVPLFSFEDQERFDGLLSECYWKKKKRISTSLKRPFSCQEAIPMGSCLLYAKY